MNATTAPALRTLISAQELRDALAAGTDVLIADTRFELTDPQAGALAWRQGHVPGSFHIDLERDLSAPKTTAGGTFRGRHPLPERAAFAQWLGRLGVTPQTLVVSLDAHGGPYAARLWWMLRWVGHANAAVLDGGLAAWTGSGGTLVTEEPAPRAPTAFAPRDALVSTIDAETLLQRLGQVSIVDARAGERFRGEVEPLDKAAGHIPGALNRFFKDNLDADGRFKSATQLRAEFGQLLGLRKPAEVVQQCGSGVTACQNLLAMEHAGLTGTTLYPGSWSEWSSDPGRPIAKG